MTATGRLAILQQQTLDGDVKLRNGSRMAQKALMLPMELIAHVDAIATARSLSRAAVARDLLRRGLEDYQREQRMLDALRQPIGGAA